MFRTPHLVQIHLNHFSASPFARWHPNPQRANPWLLSLRRASFKKSKDYYSILGITKDATQSDVRSAYLKLVKQWHPDLHPKEPAKTKARQKFIAIREAYEVLHPGITRRRKPNPVSRSQSNARGRGPYERPRHKTTTFMNRQEWARTRQRKQRPKSNPLSNNEILAVAAILCFLFLLQYWLIGFAPPPPTIPQPSSTSDVDDSVSLKLKRICQGKDEEKKTYLSDPKPLKLLGPMTNAQSDPLTTDVLAIGLPKPRDTRLLSDDDITVDFHEGNETFVVMAMVVLLPIVLVAFFVWRQLESKAHLELVTAESTAKDVEDDEAAVESRDSKSDSSPDNQETIALQTDRASHTALTADERQMFLR